MESTHHSYQPAGKVAHSSGVVNGVIQNGYSCQLYTDLSYKNFEEDYINSPLLSVSTNSKEFFKIKSIWQIYKKIRNDRIDFLIIRKAGFSSLILIPLLSILIRVFRWLDFYDTKLICEVNGISFDYKGGFYRYFVPFGLTINKMALFFSDYLYVVNEDLGRKFTLGFLGKNKKNVIVVNNGGPDPTDVSAKKSNITHFVYFGVLKDYYDIDGICNFANYIEQHSLKNAIIHVIGFGELEGKINVTAMKNNSLIYYGRKSRKNFGDIISNLEGRVFGCIPLSIGNGSGQMTPIKAFEYMSFGLPLITTSSCLKGYARDQENSLIYDNVDSKSFTNICLKALSLNWSEYESMKKNVIDEYANHTWKSRMLGLTTALYNKVFEGS
jgi:glycosyltransferase involved in cell wall biosynthesis